MSVDGAMFGFFFGGGVLRRWHDQEQWGVLVRDFQFADFFVCVEPDGSLDNCGLRQGAYVVFELHTKNNGVRDPRNLRLATYDEIVAYMPHCEPSVNSVKNTDFDLFGGLVVEVPARRGLPQKKL